MHHFVKAAEDYKRDINIVPVHIRAAATYLSKMRGIPFAQALAFITKKSGPGSEKPLTAPDVLILEKESPGNRVKKVMKFDTYLSDAVAVGNIVSPTLATYINPLVDKSLLALYIDGNLQKRKDAKKAMFVAQQESFAAIARGDMDMATHYQDVEKVKDSEQSSVKIKNNSLSGAHSSPHTILYNKSSHSTLTSSCRTATSFGNANNEKFLYGNRHYWAPEIVQSNIISIICSVDLVRMATVMEKYGLVHPTVEQTIECIEYSSDLYWKNAKAKENNRSLIHKLSDIERSAVCYAGDFYHLAKYNRAVSHRLVDMLSSRNYSEISMEEADKHINSMDADLFSLVSMLCGEELNGLAVKEIRATSEADYLILGATARYIPTVLDEYADFIKAFWVTDTLPASVANVPTMVRRCAIASDTDSTIFTTQHWTQWFVGKLDFSRKSNNVRDAMVYLASQNIRHVLAQMSANMGVMGDNLFRLAMKNEYTFPVFGLTGRAKHYFAYQSAREGVTYKEMHKEIKGVALRSSNVPAHVNAAAHKMITDTMDTIMAGDKINLRKTLDRIGALEQDIHDSVTGGKYNYLTRTQIRDMDSYKSPETGAYYHYGLWEEVFAPKYGHTEAPPYAAVKVSISTNNASRTKAWLAGMEDRELAARMEAWMLKRGRKQLSTILLPENVLSQTGVPTEIVEAINVRKLIATTIDPFYLFLESLNIHYKNKGFTRLAYDRLQVVEAQAVDHNDAEEYQREIQQHIEEMNRLRDDLEADDYKMIVEDEDEDEEDALSF